MIGMKWLQVEDWDPHITKKMLKTKARTIMALCRPNNEAELLSACTKFESSTTFKHERCASGNELDVDPEGL